MKNWLDLTLAAAVAAAVGALSTLIGPAERGTHTAEARGAADEASALRATLTELQNEQQALAQRLAALPAASAPASSSRAPLRDLDEAIAAYRAKQIGADAADAPGGSSPDELEVAALADRILSGQMKGDELQALWQKLRQEKRIDAVVAEIERQAALAPNNPDLQNELGKAYLQKLFDVGIGPMAAAWGDKADKAFDHALELDDTHWEARFHKALALSNWPTFLGKQSESIHQFELLMGQQERASPSPEHALTYYYLGNMYDQAGEHDKAVATWKRGLERFPDNERLRQKNGGR